MKGTDKNTLTAIAVLTMGLAGSALAEPDYDAVEEQIRSLAPDVQSIALSETPINGLLQAQVDHEVIYVSDDGKYLLQGTMFEIETRTNMTDQAKSVMRKELLSDIDQSQSIAFSPDNPDYELLVFTDIDCGYCRKLHDQVDEYNAQGIAIRYMAYPRAGLGSHSYDKYVSVWCADDQQSALTLAKGGDEPLPLQCANPVSDQYELGRTIGVTGTPALLASDGTLIPGYMPPDKLRERLESIAAQSAVAP